MADIFAPVVSRALYGGVFDIDGAGQYPGLELINFLVSSPNAKMPETESVRITRTAHDFARRLICEEELDEEARRAVLLDTHSEQAIIKLLKCLEMKVSNTVKAKSWGRTHFFPYTRSLVHWDARIRKDGSQKKVRLERLYLRGGGTYAYSVLRHDKNLERKEKIEKGILELYPEHSDSPPPLEMLAATLAAKGARDADPVEDQIETDSKLFDDKWEELYRDGILNVLSHSNASTVERVRAVVTWTGLWLVFMISGRTSSAMNQMENGLILDCAGNQSQLRRASQRSYKSQLSGIEHLSNEKAKELGGKLSPQQLGKIRGFFGNTAVACGLANAWKGRRHFLLKLEAIEALVMAGLQNGVEQEFDRFVTEFLFERCGLVIGRSAATMSGMLSGHDATIFEDNERFLAEQMHATGMLRMYSDATRMVSYGSY